jgi:hypothetical protein
MREGQNPMAKSMELFFIQGVVSVLLRTDSADRLEFLIGQLAAEEVCPKIDVPERAFMLSNLDNMPLRLVYLDVELTLADDISENRVGDYPDKKLVFSVKKGCQDDVERAVRSLRFSGPFLDRSQVGLIEFCPMEPAVRLASRIFRRSDHEQTAIPGVAGPPGPDPLMLPDERFEAVENDFSGA